MAFYENTIIAKQDLAKKDIKDIKDRYSDLINKTSGKVLKVEDWGLLSLANNIKNYKKGFYIHYKFQGNKETLLEIGKKIKLDRSIVRNLVVKYKNLDMKTEYFKNQE